MGLVEKIQESLKKEKEVSFFGVVDWGLRDPSVFELPEVPGYYGLVKWEFLLANAVVFYAAPKDEMKEPEDLQKFLDKLVPDLEPYCAQEFQEHTEHTVGYQKFIFGCKFYFEKIGEQETRVSEDFE